MIIWRGVDVIIALVMCRFLFVGLLGVKNSIWVYVWTFLILAFVSLFIFKSELFENKVESIVFLLIMLLGGTTILTSPPTVGVSWDDEVHYSRVLDIANAFNGIDYEADNKNIAEYADRIYNGIGYDRNSRKEYVNELNKLYAEKKVAKYESENFIISYIAYIPAALGIIVGRGLHLKYEYIFMFGRLFNLLFYAFVIYKAMKKVKYGKMLIAIISMIPSLIFMASSFGYDSWINSLVILGYAYFFSIMQDDKVDNTDAAVMILAIMFGCFAKAIYFVLFLPLFFIPKQKFRNEKQRKYYYIALTLAVLVLIVSFVYPMLFQTDSMSDIRGGADVDAKGQIFFILQHPLQYAKILLGFLVEYLRIENCWYFQYLAYPGKGKYWGIILVTLAVVAFIDRNPERNTRGGLMRVMVFLAVVCSMVLVPTALYICFTPVAANTVLGCQYRYIFPVMYPFLNIVASDGVVTKYKKKWMVGIPLLIMIFAHLTSIYDLLIVLY